MKTSTLISCGIMAVAVIFGTGFLGGCKRVSKELDKIRADMKEELEKTRMVAAESLRQSTERMALAVPGERWLKLIDDLNGSDAEKAAQARTFLRKVAGINPDSELHVSVWIEYEGGGPIAASIFRATTTGRNEVARALAVKDYRFSPVTATNLEQMELADVRRRITESTTRLVDAIGGRMLLPDGIVEQKRERVNGQLIVNRIYRARIDTVGSAIPSQVEWVSEHPPFGRLSVESTLAERRKHYDAIALTRKKVVEQHVNALMSAFESHTLGPAPATRTLPWSMLDQRQILFVMIHEEDWERIRGKNLKITAAVHEVGKPNAVIHGQGPYVFHPDEFHPSRNEPLPSPEPRGGRVVWACANMTSHYFLDEGSAAQHAKVLEIVREWEQASLNAPPAPAPN